MTLENLDVSNLPEPEITHGQCQVISLGTAIAPTTVTVELPHSDGSRVAARWNGHPSIAVGDYVRIQRRADDTIYEIISTSAGTVSAAMPQNPLTGRSGWLINKQGELLEVR